MTKNISIIAAEFDSDYSGILVYVVINGVKHLYGEQLVEREYGFRRADVGDDDAGDCFTVIDDEENPQLDSEEQKIFDDIIDTGMGILGADEDGYIKPENRTVIKSNHYGVKKVGELINFRRSLKMAKEFDDAGIRQASEETQALSHLSGWHVQVNFNIETGEVWGSLKTQDNRSIFNDSAIHSFFAVTPLSPAKIKAIIKERVSDIR